MTRKHRFASSLWARGSSLATFVHGPDCQSSTLIVETSDLQLWKRHVDYLKEFRGIPTFHKLCVCV